MIKLGDRVLYCRPRYSADPKAPKWVECAAVVTQCDDSDVVNLAYFEPDGRCKSAESVEFKASPELGCCYAPA